MKQKVLFIDRDGTLILEPPLTFQVDSLELLEFLPGVFRNLYNLRKLNVFQFVIVSNQDGLGTPANPMDKFELVQSKVLKSFTNEGIEFEDILIDPSRAEDDSPNRKPKTGMLTSYMQGNYDLENSYVIGDRMTDIELARNIGARGILIGGDDKKQELKDAGLEEFCAMVADDWDAVYRFIRSDLRRAKVIRKTNETDIRVELALDGDGNSEISTGLGFLDHMLDQIARHGNFDLNIKVDGDLQVDEHHTIEDTALALGDAFLQAMGDKRGINRYGFTLPMDDCLASVTVDFGGRPWLVWEAEFSREMVGDVPTEMFLHFFKSFSDTAKANLNIKAEGTNEHHKIESIFKAFAKALSGAVAINAASDKLPSTKGAL